MKRILSTKFVSAKFVVERRRVSSTFHHKQLCMLGLASVVMLSTSPAYPLNSTANADLMRQADDLHRKHIIDKAYAMYNKILAEDPNNLSALEGRANCLLEMDENKQALVDITNILRINPKNSFALTMRGIALRNSADPKSAIDIFTKAIAIDPNYTGAYIQRAITEMSTGDFPAALQDYATAIKLTPNEPTIYSNRGGAFVLSGQYDKALSDFDKSLSLSPENFTAYLNRGACLRSMGRNKESIESLNNALRCNATSPERAQAYRNLAETREKINDLENASKDLAESIRLRPNDAATYIVIGRIESKKGNEEAARQQFAKAISLDPSNASAYLEKAQLPIQQGNWSESLAILTDGEKHCKPNCELYSNLAGVHFMMKHSDEAIAYMSQAIAISPDPADLYRKRAHMESYVNRSNQAEADLAIATKLKPRNWTNYVESSRIQTQEKNLPAAMNTLSDGLKVSDDCENLFFYRGIAHLEAKEFDLAISDFKNGIQQSGADEQNPHVYGGLLAGLIAKKLKQPDDMKAIFAKVEPSSSAEWPAPLFEFVKGSFAADDLLKSAKTLDQQTQAHTYIGLSELLSGHKKEALEHFQWVLSYGEHTRFPYDISAYYVSVL